jgi:iron(III) transport system ATP-binding protein
MNFLNVSSVSKRGTDRFILNDVSLSQTQGEKVAVAGETGSGKSTLLKIVAGLAQADSGTVEFEGQRVQGAMERLVPGHPRIAYLSQHFELQKFLRVEQVLAYANTLSDEESSRLYRVCQIDHLLTRKTDQLSGGERQRIALARNLVTAPSLLMLDEPFSNLDIPHKNTLKEVIEDLSSQLGISLILVSHDPADTLSWADRILVLKEGQVTQWGTPYEIYRTPSDAYTAGLFGRFNALEHRDILQLGAEDFCRFTRPEDFRLEVAGNPGIDVVVSDVRYFGSHYEIEVRWEAKSCVVSVSSNSISVGDKAVLQLAERG